MKLYEINAEIQRLTDSIVFDEETGEILGNAEDLFKEIESLEMSKKMILEWLAKSVLNLRSDISSVKAEESRLKSYREKLEKKEERLMNVLDRECAGEKTDLGIATFSYRKTAHVEVDDMRQAIQWLESNNHSDCIRIREPEVSKSEVKKLINKGIEVPGCTVINGYSCTLK